MSGGHPQNEKAYLRITEQLSSGWMVAEELGKLGVGRADGQIKEFSERSMSLSRGIVIPGFSGGVTRLKILVFRPHQGGLKHTFKTFSYCYSVLFPLCIGGPPSLLSVIMLKSQLLKFMP